MDSVLIIGAGAAGSVVAQKCAMNRDVFKKIHLASRRLESCKKVAARCKGKIGVHQVDADNVKETVALIEKVKPDLIINMALPYQDLAIMDACLKTGVHYMDTANYEPRDEAKFTYKWQWPYHDKFAKKGIMAILGCGFDPGQSNIYCAYAQEFLFDEINQIDIVDCNDGSHGKAFATNFNPEINLREVTQRGKYWKKGKWIEIDPLTISCMVDYPGGRPAQELPDLSRGGGEPRREHQGARADPLLDDVLGQLHQASRGAAERRHDPHRPGHVQGQPRDPDGVPEGAAAAAVVAGRELYGQARRSAASSPARRAARRSGR